MKISRIPMDLRIALLYSLFGGLWIVISDQILQSRTDDLATFSRLDVFKGWIFVLLSAALIYFMVRRALAEYERIEGERRKTEHLYHLLADRVSDVIWILDLETMRFLYISPSVEWLRGYSVEEAMQQSAEESLTPASWQRLKEALPGRIKAFREGDTSSTYTDVLEQPHKNGTTIWIEVHSHCIVNEENGQLEVHGVSRDVTERRRAETILRQSEERYRQLFETSPEAILIHDGEVILDANPATALYLGYGQVEELRGTRVMDRISPEHRIAGEAHIRTILSKDIVTPLKEIKLLRKDGSAIQAEIRAGPLFYEEKKVVQTVFHDVTRRKETERALKAAEEKYRSIFDGAVEGIFQSTPEGRFIAVNPALATMWGYESPRDLIDSVHDIASQIYVQPELRDEYSRAFQEKGEVRRFEFQTRRKDGTPIWVSENARAIRNAQGEIEYYEGYIQDITQSREARIERERLLQTLDASLNEIYIFDVASLKFQYVNAGARQNLGYSIEQLQDMTPLELKPQLSEAAFREYLELLLQGRQQIVIFETMHRRADASLYPVEVHLQLVEREGDCVFLAIIKDITDRKRAERSLHESEQRYRTLAEAAQEMIFIIDPHRKVSYVNEYGARQFGRHPSEIVGKNLEEVFPAEVADQRWESLQTIMNRGEPDYFENSLPLGSHEVWLGTNLVPIKNDHGEIEGVLGVSRDITARKRIEEALRTSEEKYRKLFSEMLAGCALHEMICDENGQPVDYVTLDTNSSFEKLLGAGRADVIGKKASELLPPDELKKWLEIFGPVALEGKSIRYDMFSPLNAKHFEGNAFCPEKGKFAVTFTDITERKRAEEKIQQQLRRITALRDIDRIITSSLDLDLTLNRLLIHVTEQLPVDATRIMLFDAHTFTLECRAKRGFRERKSPDLRLALGDEFAGKVALERRSIHLDLSDSVELPPDKNPILGQDFVEYYGLPLISKGQLRGVLEVFHRSKLSPDADWLDYLDTLAGQAALAIDNLQTFDRLQRSNIELVRAYDATIEGWSRALDMRDRETEGHTQRVTALTMALASEFGCNGEELANIRWGSLLHDIGKMGIPDSILLKPGPLTDAEWALMKCHPEYAYEMLSRIQYLHGALDIPYYHHERWDGSGYPQGLKGEQIPLAARIFAIVDIWDALRSNRSYRPAWSEKKALQHIRELSGTHLDPKVVEMFMNKKIYELKATDV